MAKPAWVTLNKTSGTGNSTFTASAAVYTGRVSRTGSITVTSTKDTTKKATISVAQTLKPEFLTAVKSAISIPAAAGQAVFELSSNSKYFFWVPTSLVPTPKVECYVSGDTIGKTLISNKINDSLYYVEIPNDAGATAQYNLKFIFSVPVNETIRTKDYTITVAGGSANATTMPTTNKITLTATQAAKIVTLSASPTSITIPAAGTAQTVTITSNDAWTIS